jgi:hypothetical protein
VAAEVRKTVAEMFGDFWREAAVLTAVFLPMDWILVEKNVLTWTFFLNSVGLCLGLLVFGIVIERVR